MATQTKKVPFCGGERCYACDAKPVGLCDRKHMEEGRMEPACARHADPTIRIFHACNMCLGPVRTGSLEIDGEFRHQKCELEGSRGW